MSILSTIKDNLVTQLKPIINSYLSDMGSLKEIHLDSQAKTLKLTIDLKGESSPIKIDVLKYELVKKEKQNFLIIKKIEFSREWINIAIKRWKPDMRIPIPVLAATALK